MHARYIYLLFLLVLTLGGSAMYLDVLNFNPMNASITQRLEEIWSCCHGFDLAILTGTGFPIPSDPPPLGVVRVPVNEGVMLQMGYGKGAHTNKACGVGFLFTHGKKSILRKKHVVDIKVLNGPAAGRAAMIRRKFKGHDFAFFAAYMPPTPRTRQAHKKYLRTAH